MKLNNFKNLMHSIINILECPVEYKTVDYLCCRSNKSDTVAFGLIKSFCVLKLALRS